MLCTSTTAINKCTYDVASQLQGIAMYIYTLYYSQLLCYKSCMLEHQQKSGCAPTMIVYTVFTMLRALIFPVQYSVCYPTRDLLRRLVAMSHNPHYHIVNLYNNEEVNSIQHVFNLLQLCENHYSVYTVQLIIKIKF